MMQIKIRLGLYSDLSKKIAILATKAELKAGQDIIVKQ